ncbi:phytoene desaturase family protein [Nocardioides bizhenqiangii]|uniref:Pyridine nucleotide-disulfide oxidoreductase domain-containing protein 2 n=1 Tax=Nocardioides bizhenqiangii TaxID=3095076 RepID=A0ABZ0ZVK2_9ACTN|nr:MULTISPECIES: NAD(P)/FAD-dependent oxidoreductase [unclassified Nocardioides]MDZ5622484.1 NAD(P)/FAD-dependent oxidoreductase [Nocardioides sp. HM23]WQQ28357.1 NAD(P)/FAD-dependent oxidoreductase [Nocardioides sp. HM61]
MTRGPVDAVVIGAGPNGLVAANALVDAGWEVLLVEANDVVGGAVRSAEVTAPGFCNDLFSAFYPLAAASPVIQGLDLQAHGLEWTQAPDVLTHVLPDDRAAVLHRRPEDTAAGLEEFAAGDGDAWLELCEQWQRVRDPLLDALFTPFPPIRPSVRLLRALGTADALDLLRQAVLPVHRLADERFNGEGAAVLLTGNAMHSDVGPDSAGSGMYGWLLCMLGQDVGFPVPQGGAQRLADALASRFRANSGELLTGTRVTDIEVSGGRATGVRLADGTRVDAKRAVLADVDAPTLYGEMVDAEHLPARFLAALERFHWDNPTLKFNWALREPVPWTAAGARGAGTVHVGVDEAGFVDFAADLSNQRAPRAPFVLFGQMSTADPTRSPPGTESAWAYTHLPHRVASDPHAVDAVAEQVRQLIETHAPGFADTVLAEQVQRPHDLEEADSNLVDGALNAGTSGIHQQLIFRPTPGLGRPETPIEGLYLAGASAHPGGGVHGACGWNAARSALGGSGIVRKRLLSTAWARLLERPGR